MPRNKRYKPKSYKPKGYKKYKTKSFKNNNNIFANDIANAVVTAIIIYILFWLFFGLAIFFSILWLFYYINKLNDHFGLYDISYYGAIITYIIGFICSFFLIVFIGQNLGKIDENFLNGAKGTSNYVSISNKGGHPSMEINKEGIVEEVVVYQIEDESMKQLAEIPNKIVEGIIDAFHNLFVILLKNIFNLD